MARKFVTYDCGVCGDAFKREPSKVEYSAKKWAQLHGRAREEWDGPYCSRSCSSVAIGLARALPMIRVATRLGSTPRPPEKEVDVPVSVFETDDGTQFKDLVEAARRIEFNERLYTQYGVLLGQNRRLNEHIKEVLGALRILSAQRGGRRA